MPNAQQEQFFFKQGNTLDALSKLAASDELVIYCGAGVSIDRTDVSWQQLVASVFSMARLNKPDSFRTQAQSVEYLLNYLDDPRQAASIVVQTFASPGQTDNAFLASKLKDILYEKSGWNQGYLLRNLIQASFQATQNGRRVVIITTNYDTFIESEFEMRRAELEKIAAPETLPGLIRRVYDGDTYTAQTMFDHGADAGDVEVIYIHGRVDKIGGAEGNIVLTERSYAESRDRSVNILKEYFAGKSRGILMVGASLTDEPLIHALALTKQDAGHRYALLTAAKDLTSVNKGFVPKGDTVVITPKSVGEAIEMRGKHLGVSLLRTLSHSQSAQFLEELRMSIITGAIKHDRYYGSTASQVSYSARLARWHADWAKRGLTKSPQKTYKVLSDGLRDIHFELKEKAESGEHFRVEVWARRNPSTTNRVMTLWGTSTGPILDKSMYRTEPVSPQSSNASVQAFLAGRPMLLSLDTLGFPDTASRWKTFLSVPIFVQVSAPIDEVDTEAYVPAGVITLTSDRRLTGTEGDTSVFASGALDMEKLRAIKHLLIGMGREILRAND